MTKLGAVWYYQFPCPESKAEPSHHPTRATAMLKRSTHLLFLALLLASTAPAYADDPAGIEFFEKKIRPVLVEHCYRCHSAKAPRLRGKLRLDTAAGASRDGAALRCSKPCRRGGASQASGLYSQYRLVSVPT
jgi:hypothetical protein